MRRGHIGCWLLGSVRDDRGLFGQGGHPLVCATCWLCGILKRGGVTHSDAIWQASLLLRLLRQRVRVLGKAGNGSASSAIVIGL